MTKVSERKSVNRSCVQAARVAKVVKKGKHTAEKRKTWLKPTFRLPKTAKLPRNERAISHSVKVEPTFDKYAVVKYPKSTESAMKITEDHNTLVFIVDRRANKHMIKQSINKLYGIKVRKVNTMITPRGEKKAYVMLTKEHDALETASKIGIM